MHKASLLMLLTLVALSWGGQWPAAAQQYLDDGDPPVQTSPNGGTNGGEAISPRALDGVVYCNLAMRHIRLYGGGEKTSIPGLVVYIDRNTMTIALPRYYSLPGHTCDVYRGHFMDAQGNEISERDVYSGIPASMMFDVRSTRTGKLITVRRQPSP